MANPRDAQITVIGGGAVGAAVAYFLARAGYRDIQLLDKQGLPPAWTWEDAERQARAVYETYYPMPAVPA